MNPKLRAIPSEVLWDPKTLSAWCEAKRFRPLLSEIDEERRRRAARRSTAQRPDRARGRRRITHNTEEKTA